MFGRKLSRIVLVLLAAWALRGKVVFAQGDDAEAARIRAEREAQRQAELRAAEEEKQQRERGIKALNDFLIDTRTRIAPALKVAEAQRERDRALQLNRFRIAFEEFETARTELSEALGLKAKLKDPAQRIAKSTAVFLDFIKRTNEEPSRFDPSEFKDFTPKELGWEALTSAERLGPPVASLMVTESEFTVDVRYLKFLSQLQAELLRLQWIAKRLK